MKFAQLHYFYHKMLGGQKILYNNYINNDILLRTHGPYYRHKSTKSVLHQRTLQTSAHITETVLAHDQQWEEQSSLSSPQLYRHLQKHRKWITIQ